MVGRTSESSEPSSAVSRSSISSIEHRAAEQPRPARVRAPSLEVRGDRVDDLAVEVEAEVVARREVGEPVVADADHAAVDLVDDRVHHRVGGLELARSAQAASQRSIHRTSSRGRGGPGRGAALGIHKRDIGVTAPILSRTARVAPPGRFPPRCRRTVRSGSECRCSPSRERMRECATRGGVRRRWGPTPSSMGPLLPALRRPRRRPLRGWTLLAAMAEDTERRVGAW